MPLSKRSRGETSRPTGQQHLYLIFDDWPWGYSIRELNLSNAGAERQRLPAPFIRLEAKRGCPEFFAAVGTKILATHPRDDSLDPGGILILPIIDVRSRGVNLAPGELYPQHPIYLPVSNERLFALDIDTFKMLSMKELWPPRQEPEYRHQISEWWSWHNLPMPTFERMDVTSYAVDSDGQTILASTADAIFAFDPQLHEWKRRAEWSLPFSGRATFVHGLDVFVGLPKDVDAFGHLCFCRWLGGDDKYVCICKENLSSKGPAESHVGTTLVYLGETRFCLVECFSNVDSEAEEWGEPRCCLTTFSLRSDTNGDLTAAVTAVQCYEVPVGASDNVNPVAFWL